MGYRQRRDIIEHTLCSYYSKVSVDSPPIFTTHTKNTCIQIFLRIIYIIHPLHAINAALWFYTGLSRGITQAVPYWSLSGNQGGNNWRRSQWTRHETRPAPALCTALYTGLQITPSVCQRAAPGPPPYQPSHRASFPPTWHTGLSRPLLPPLLPPAGQRRHARPRVEKRGNDYGPTTAPSIHQRGFWGVGL